MDCLSLIEISENQYCPFCFPPKITKQGKTCPNCKKQHFLDGLICATSFDNKIIKQAIHLFKYPPFLKELSKPLSCLIINQLKLLNNITSYFSDFVFVPIPIAKKRMLFRGFNQSQELAKEISIFLNIETKNILTKKINTPPQTTLSKNQRIKNILNVFSTDKSFENAGSNKKILLVDDVFTTGSTINEAARILKENGAKEVWAITIARE